MTPEELERLAREAGATVYTNRHFKTEPATAFHFDALARFAALVRAQALEQAAQAVQTKHPKWCECGRCHDAPQIAAAIRALIPKD